MSEVWHLLKKSLRCKPHALEVHDPKAYSSTQRKPQGKISTQRHSLEDHVSHEIFLDRSSGEIMLCPCCPCSHEGSEDGKGVQEEPHPPRSTKRIIPSSKTHYVDCDECNFFSKKKVPLKKDSNDDLPISTRHHECDEKLKSTDTVEEHDHNIPEHSVVQLERDGSSCKIIQQICKDNLIESKASQIECVLRVQNKQETFACFEESRGMVRTKAERLQNEHPRCMVDGNELLRFHGTTIACSLGLNGSSTLCTLEQCGVCQILRHGFSANKEFHGALGVYTTSTSEKAIDSICSSNKSVRRMCVMLCRVIAGRIHNPLQEIKEMVEPEFDSLVKKMSDQSEIEELIVLNPRAVLPCFLEWDLTAFVDLIEDDDDEGLFALVTALNLYRYRVKDFLLHKCRGPRKMSRRKSSGGMYALY
ncbi:hypothetical protein JHK85_013279 [Glycine max]|uniref:Uncharacterized protein n=1 Tax=Glycine soja TaxID=3848 RepID=A0A0B2SNF1_GLYSO|nr:hypothetical protein JHK85_013279 [Glycine max]KHN46084.1 hypothetical protein glysoja_030085 [Glycine soja]